MAAPTVTAITPPFAAKTTGISITNLAGTGFSAGPPLPVVKLTKAEQSDIIAASVALPSATQITCIFDLTGALEGTWNIVVTNTGAAPNEGTLADGFTVCKVLVTGCDRAAKIPKKKRIINTGVRLAGTGGTVRPTVGQIFPRGIKG